MHILFLTDNFPPEVNAPASRTYEHCREWVQRPECAVTVITCVPNFPRGEIFEGYKSKLIQVEWIDGIKVIRVWSFIASNEGTFKRILDYLSFMFMAVLASIFVRKVDIIVATSPQFFTALAGYIVSVLKKRPWVFELRDIWPESIKVVGAMENTLLIRVLERLELFLYKKATRVIPVTYSFKSSLAQRGVDPRKIHVVTNGVDISRFSPTSKDTELLLRFGLDGKFIAGYIGTHGLAHSLDTILEAAAILIKSHPESDIRFLLLGDGAEKERLQELASELKLTNVVFVDSVSKSEVPKYWSLLDVSIVHLKCTPLFETVIPSKIFECMSMGLPIAHGVRGESADIVATTMSGLTFEPENAADLVSVLRRMASDRGLLARLSKNGCESAKNFDRTVKASEMLEILSRTVDPIEH